MKILMKLSLAFILGTSFGILGADAAISKKRPKQTHIRKAAYGGEALRPKKNLEFDGQSIQSLKASKYDSLATQSGDGSKGGKRLYSLPADFQSRAADSEMEMRYRQ